MKLVKAVCGGMLAIASIVSTSTLAQINLANLPYVTYGDGTSYSLPISEFLGCTTCEVMAGPGQIAVFAKLGLGADGQLPNSIPGMDDAFETPEPNNIDGFRMSAANEPTPTFTGDRPGWWDSTLAALSSKLDLLKNSIVFFFANNETGQDDHLAAYAKVELTGPDGSLGIFELTNDFNKDGVAPYGAFLSGGGIPSDVNPLAYQSYTSGVGDQTPVVADFLQSGGEVCIPTGPMTQECFQHNLGGDRAAYAVVFPELDALIAGVLALPNVNLENYVLHVEYRLGCGTEDNTAQGSPSFPRVDGSGPPGTTECDGNYALNGGAEKVFLGTQLLPGQVPEPSSLLLACLGLLGLICTARRKNII